MGTVFSELVTKSERWMEERRREEVEELRDFLWWLEEKFCCSRVKWINRSDWVR